VQTRTLLLGAVASLSLAGAADAAHFKGWYIGLEGGGSWVEDADTLFFVDLGGEFEPGTTTGTLEFDTGWAVFATMGYAFESNWRLEAEVGYRANETSVGALELNEWSLMLNALYDIELTPKLALSIGAGAGYDHATLEVPGLDDSDGNFAYQGIAGLNYALSNRLDLTLTYRYLIVDDPEFDLTAPPITLGFDVESLRKHSVTIGLRYDLAPDEEPAPPPLPAEPPPPPPPPVKNFVIFFGFAKCNITPEADAVLGEAATAAKEGGGASVKIVGHTDTVGSPRYNQKLSECRAGAAKTNLVSKGVPDGAITTSGKGEGELLVQTADGVKEPQNRRATIDIE
jgi:OOP family OmpA-OmpF porin